MLLKAAGFGVPYSRALPTRAHLIMFFPFCICISAIARQKYEIVVVVVIVFRCFLLCRNLVKFDVANFLFAHLNKNQTSRKPGRKQRPTLIRLNASLPLSLLSLHLSPALFQFLLWLFLFCYLLSHLQQLRRLAFVFVLVAVAIAFAAAVVVASSTGNMQQPRQGIIAARGPYLPLPALHDR